MLLTVIQMILSLFDLVGLLIIGLIGSLATQGVRSLEFSETQIEILTFLQIDTYSFQIQIAVFAVFATVFFVGKSILSIYFTKKTMNFLSLRSAFVTRKLYERALKDSKLMTSMVSSQNLSYGILEGVRNLMTGVVATVSLILSDIFLLIVVVCLLVLVEPFTAVGTFFFFSCVAWVTHWKVNTETAELAHKEAELTIRNREIILESIKLHREIVVRNNLFEYVKFLGSETEKAAVINARLLTFPMFSKYILESSVIIGAILMSGIQFAVSDAAKGISALAIFLVATSRIAPAILRIQQGVILIKSSAGRAMPTIDLYKALPEEIQELEHSNENLFDHKGFLPKVSLLNVHGSYEEVSTFRLGPINLDILEGSICAIVGPSGSGKTSLVDLMLGIISPRIGEIKISGRTPKDALKSWPGSVAYVPQETFIANTSIENNIRMGFQTLKSTKEDALIHESIAISQLGDYISKLPLGLQTLVGEGGDKLSGGERQRLGLARALYTKPKLLVLDESTSALDSETEKAVTGALKKLRGRTTMVIVAHRLSTVMEADQVVYLSEGQIRACGTFDEVRKAIPDFDSQASLLGL